MEILLIGNGSWFLAEIAKSLESFSYIIEILDFSSSLNLCQELHFDLIVLDSEACQLDSREQLEALRKESSVPIFLFLPEGEKGQGIKSLDAGADDYLVKPFATKEFLARTRSILRRASDNVLIKSNVW